MLMLPALRAAGTVIGGSFMFIGRWALSSPQTIIDELDSSYVAQSSPGNTPESARSSSIGSCFFNDKAPPVPSGFRSLPSLTELDIGVDEATLEVPGRKYRPIAMRLMVLGHSEEEAKACIVVLCLDQHFKRIKRFFDKTSVKTLCRPEDDTQPAFDVFVLGQPPQTKQADKTIAGLLPIVERNWRRASGTYCGSPIIFRHPSGVERLCTFSGMIQVVQMNGDIKFYGLTIGQVFFDESEDDLIIGTEKDEPSGDFDWEIQLSDSEGEHGFDCAYEEGVADGDGPGPDTFHGWTAIEILSFKPNIIGNTGLLRDKTQNSRASKFKTLQAPTSPLIPGRKQPVILLSGSEGLKQGYLLGQPSRLLLAPGMVFVDTIILKLNDEDSGSWVVNEKPIEVYGYVVTADAFRRGYVLPLVEEFHHIKDILECQSVKLASTSSYITEIRKELILKIEVRRREAFESAWSLHRPISSACTIYLLGVDLTLLYTHPSLLLFHGDNSSTSIDVYGITLA
ncbi:hypothetical protein EDB81DRAFT_951399 [Dactylonectria macrodidyma]|uniref:Uncharacterized protein n=1 Tax=Dactylonectria macrodidyma TaxID=307937 RepID=A0A9P9DV70_9HYPO|nr:hypothetical protein EDB81DRAFT_951399 [Dactylonectria macrodidyma]